MATTTSDDIKKLENQLLELQKENNGLLKIISHDIRSPFNKIHAFIQLMKMEEDNLNTNQLEYLDNMHIAVMSGLELVRNMHDVKVVEDDKMDIKKEQCDLNLIITKAIQNFDPLAELKNTRVHFNSNCKNPLVLADPYYLQRAIENVISNAVKFTSESKPINVELKLEDKIYSISFTNFGQNIPMEELDLLFKKFSKLSPKPTKGEGSSGLGLFLTHKFLEKMDGEIFYQNQEKGMTTFVIQLPS